MTTRVKAYLTPVTTRKGKQRIVRTLAYIDDGQDGFTFGNHHYDDYDSLSAALGQRALQQAGNDLLPDDEMAIPDHL